VQREIENLQKAGGKVTVLISCKKSITTWGLSQELDQGIETMGKLLNLTLRKYQAHHICWAFI